MGSIGVEQGAPLLSTFNATTCPMALDAMPLAPCAGHGACRVGAALAGHSAYCVALLDGIGCFECCCRLVGGSCAKQRFKARKKRSKTLPRNSWGECPSGRGRGPPYATAGVNAEGRGAAGPLSSFFAIEMAS